MKILPVILLSTSVLAGCSGVNPITGGTPSDDSSDVGGPGTCTAANTACSGEVNQFNYNPSSDTLTINNLPFDLRGTYDRLPGVSVNGFPVYMNDGGDEIYLAIFGTGPSGTVEGGVVGTGGYVDFGYGGTVFRSTGASLPQVGEATFTGDYAGMRIYQGTGVVHFVTGDLDLRIDFDDFDVVGAVDLTITDREAWTTGGTSAGVLPYLSGSTTQLSGIRMKSTAIAEIDGAGNTVAQGETAAIFGGTIGTGLDGEVAGTLTIQGPDALGGPNEVKETGFYVGSQVGYNR